MTLSVSFLAANGWQTTIEDHRQLTKAAFGSGTGVLAATDFQVTPMVGELGVSVAPGFLVIEGNDHSAQGSYLFWDDDDNEVAAVAPGPVARIDTLLAVVADAQYGTLTGDEGPRFVWATGTPNASPVALSDSEIESDWAEPGAWARVA